MTLINYKPNRKGGFDLRTLEGKRGEIKKRGGTWKAIVTRPVSLEVLTGVCAFVGDLNKGLAG